MRIFDATMRVISITLVLMTMNYMSKMVFNAAVGIVYLLGLIVLILIVEPLLVPWRVWHLRLMQWRGIWVKPEPHTGGRHLQELNFRHVVKVVMSCETFSQTQNAFQWAMRVLRYDHHKQLIRELVRDV